MNKEKEIEEVEEIIEDTVVICNDYLCGTHEAAEDIIKAGYRKADEVRKETAKEILEYLRAVQEKDELKNCDLDWIAMQYGIEVGENGKE